MNLVKIAQRIADPSFEGLTTSLETGREPQFGFSVSIPGHEVTHLRVNHLGSQKAVLEILAAYIRDNFEVVFRARHHLGLWVDQGLLYVDTSIIVPDYSTAVELGTRYGQKAIYDLSTGQTIYLPQTTYGHA